MYLDIDKAYAINALLKIYEKFGENSYIRETEHGYHVKIPVQCSMENFIYCLVIRRLYDDQNRVAMDIVRLSNYEFDLAFDIVFDEKQKEGKHKIKGKWYKMTDYLALRGII